MKDATSEPNIIIIILEGWLSWAEILPESTIVLILCVKNARNPLSAARYSLLVPDEQQFKPCFKGLKRFTTKGFPIVCMVLHPFNMAHSLVCIQKTVILKRCGK